MVARTTRRALAFCAASAAALALLGCSSHTDVVATTVAESTGSDRTLGQSDDALCTPGLYKGTVYSQPDAGVSVFDTATISFAIVDEPGNGEISTTTTSPEAGLVGTTANGDTFSADLSSLQKDKTVQVCHSGFLPNDPSTITVTMSNGSYTVGQTKLQVSFGGTIRGTFGKPDGRPRFDGTWKALAHLGNSGDLPFSGTWSAELVTYGGTVDAGN
jgi:hypothetical protein